MRLLVNTLASEVSDRLLSTVEAHLENKLANAPKSQKLLVDSDELAELLSVSKSTIVSLRKKGMPTVRIGDSVRFEPEVALHFIKNLKSKSNGQNK